MSTITLHYSGSQKKSLYIRIGGSKSISQRALIINYLYACDFYKNNTFNHVGEKIKWIKKDWIHIWKNNQQLLNLSDSDDTDILFRSLLSLDSNIEVFNSGSSLRFLISLFALRNKNCIINCDQYLISRPLQPLIDVLNSLGANIISRQNTIEICNGSLHGGEVYFEDFKTSQYISSLLLVAPYLINGLKVNYKSDMYSVSYVNMTIEMLQQCGAELRFDNNSISVSQGGYKNYYMSIESDWSSASYIYLLFLFSNLETITICNFFKKSLQGDQSVLNFFSLVGVHSQFASDQELTISRPATANIVLKKKLNYSLPTSISWNFADNPDLTPTIIIACFGLGISLHGSGVKNLQYKESNRMQVMITELKKMNCIIEMKSEDTFYLDMSDDVNAYSNKLISINTYQDHRIALAFSPLCLLGFNLEIIDSSVVSKSYPSFFDDLKKFGVIIAN